MSAMLPIPDLLGIVSGYRVVATIVTPEQSDTDLGDTFYHRRQPSISERAAPQAERDYKAWWTHREDHALEYETLTEAQAEVDRLTALATSDKIKGDDGEWQLHPEIWYGLRLNEDWFEAGGRLIFYIEPVFRAASMERSVIALQSARWKPYDDEE